MPNTRSLEALEEAVVQTCQRLKLKPLEACMQLAGMSCITAGTLSREEFIAFLDTLLVNLGIGAVVADVWPKDLDQRLSEIMTRLANAPKTLPEA